MDATNETRVTRNLLRNHLRQLGSHLPPGLRRHSQGQGLLEFALILPALLLLVLGIIEFGYVFTVYTTMFNAAREGARYGMVDPQDTAGINNTTMAKIFMADPDQVYIIVMYDHGPGDPLEPNEQMRLVLETGCWSISLMISLPSPPQSNPSLRRFPLRRNPRAPSPR